MTTKTLTEIKRLNQAGKHDSEIADLLGIGDTSVRHWRMYPGLPKVEGYRRGAKQYAVYDGKTEVLVALGTARECARILGISPSSLRHSISMAKRGAYKKYSFCEVDKADGKENS